MKSTLILLAGLVLGGAVNAQTVYVGPHNFIRAETDRYMSDLLQRGELGKFGHRRLPTDLARQTVIRMNQSAGLQIHGNASASEQARIRFRGVPRAFVVQLFVARDSFTDFLPVREALTGLNLEYSLQVMPGEDVELFLSDQVRTRTYVQ